MIINENNKNDLLKGKMARGFNQDPKDLKVKIATETSAKPIQEKHEPEIKEEDLRTKIDRLRRINKWK